MHIQIKYLKQDKSHYDCFASVFTILDAQLQCPDPTTITMVECDQYQGCMFTSQGVFCPKCCECRSSIGTKKYCYDGTTGK